MALRFEDLPKGGVPLFHVADFGRWKKLGRLSTIRYCIVTCDDCQGDAFVIMRPDFVKASRNANMYNPQSAREIDTHCHTCAVRVQWENGSSHVYFCYPGRDLIDCLENGRVGYDRELADLKDRHNHQSDRTVCTHKYPNSRCRLFPEPPPYYLSRRDRRGAHESVTAERYGDESRQPLPPPPPPPRALISDLEETAPRRRKRHRRRDTKKRKREKKTRKEEEEEEVKDCGPTPSPAEKTVPVPSKIAKIKDEDHDAKEAWKRRFIEELFKDFSAISKKVES